MAPRPNATRSIMGLGASSSADAEDFLFLSFWFVWGACALRGWSERAMAMNISASSWAERVHSRVGDDKIRKRVLPSRTAIKLRK